MNFRKRRRRCCPANSRRVYACRRVLPTILVIEDDHLIQFVVEENLKEAVQIVISPPGKHAAQLRRGQVPRASTDINLGRDKLDGREVVATEDRASKGVPNSVMLIKPFAPV